MKAKLEFRRWFRFSYSRSSGYEISEESPERYYIHWQLYRKGEYRYIPIKCEEHHDERGVKFCVFSESPKYDKYFNTSEQIFFNTKKEALKAATAAYEDANAN